MTTSPQWIDLHSIGLVDGVRQLFALTSATEYVCNIDDYLAVGWSGERCRVPISGMQRDGYVEVVPVPFCPPGALFVSPYAPTAEIIAAAPEMLRLLKEVHRDGWVASGHTLDVNIGDLLYKLTRGAVGYPPKV